MDYFEGVVIEFLRADRRLFVNTHCCIQINPGRNPDTSGPHWYCDAVAVNIRDQTAYLCEITYAAQPRALFQRLEAWSSNWLQLRTALARDCGIPEAWLVMPWLFARRDTRAKVEAFIDALPVKDMPTPKINQFEDVMPWKYCSWDRTRDVSDVELSSSNL